MMTKLMKLLLIILIGLSLFLLKGCVIFGIGVDDPADKVMTGYINSSSIDIELVIRNDVFNLNTPDHPNSTYFLNSGESIDIDHGASFKRNDTVPTGIYVSSINKEETNVSYEVYSETGELLKQWTALNTEDSEHSPFNADSWEYIEFDPPIDDNIGKIVFTITDEDLE